MPGEPESPSKALPSPAQHLLGRLGLSLAQTPLPNALSLTGGKFLFWWFTSEALESDRPGLKCGLAHSFIHLGPSYIIGGGPMQNENVKLCLKKLLGISGQ